MVVAPVVPVVAKKTEEELDKIQAELLEIGVRKLGKKKPQSMKEVMEMVEGVEGHPTSAEEKKVVVAKGLPTYFDGLDEVSPEFMERRRLSGYTAFNQHMQDKVVELTGVKVQVKYIESGADKSLWKISSKKMVATDVNEFVETLSRNGFGVIGDRFIVTEGVLGFTLFTTYQPK